MKWRCLDHVFDLSKQGEVMGIVNVTPDSFSDGGRYSNVEAACNRAGDLISQGARIIDIGGESTRPGAPEVHSQEEIARVIPVLKCLAKSHPDIVLSIDTSKPEVASEAIRVGARIINDVTGFRDPDMVQLAAESGVGLVVMHMQGTPRTMQANPKYEDVTQEIREFFLQRHAQLLAAGISPEAIAYDPGIGFGKSQEHNLTLLQNLDRIEIENRPILLGVSRKSFIGKLVQSDNTEERDLPTAAITSLAREKGVRLHRVHEVQPNVEALRMTEAML